jgi:ATP-dependent DNA helicase DinG
MDTFKDAEAVLASRLPKYESRPQQQALALSVESAIANGTHLLAQAGCGTGKSLGYLIPAILSGKRTIVSTETKALQTQLATLDLPFLGEHLGVNFTWCLLKGRSNYLCLNRARLNDKLSKIPSLAKVTQAALVPGFLGDRDSLPFEVSDAEWIKMCSSADDCAELECKKNPEGCFAVQARLRAKDATVVIVNHALYATELKLYADTDGLISLLSEHDTVIFDEAHTLNDVVTDALSTSLTEQGVNSLAYALRTFTAKWLEQEHTEQIEPIVQSLVAAGGRLFRVLTEGRLSVQTLVSQRAEWDGLLAALGKALETVLTPRWYRSGKDYAHARGMITRRISSMRTKLLQATGIVDGMCTWVEVTDKRPILRAAPLSIARFLSDNLFESGRTCIMVSATLAENGSFDYVCTQLGLPKNTTSLDVGSPFNFQEQARLYIPADMPDPGREKDAWSTAALKEMLELVNHSEGRALLLFTSTSQLRKAYAALQPLLSYPCKCQGSETNKRLAEWFMSEPSSVLFATRSFMTGVDFPGDACSLVIIDKLPFPVPTEPLFQARSEAIEANGGNSFSDLSVPIMTLTLLQAFGRLIRTKSDRGVVAILDPRLATKGYGKRIVKSLPNAPRVSTLNQVKEFFA